MGPIACAERESALERPEKQGHEARILRAPVVGPIVPQCHVRAAAADLPFEKVNARLNIVHIEFKKTKEDPDEGTQNSEGCS